MNIPHAFFVPVMSETQYLNIAYILNYFNIISLIEDMVILPGDAFIAKDKRTGTVKHHFVYTGERKGTKWFIGTFIGKSIRKISAPELKEITGKLSLKGIIFFKGSMFERRRTVKRALSFKGKPQETINFNMEHFISYIHTGKIASKEIFDFTSADAF